MSTLYDFVCECGALVQVTEDQAGQLITCMQCACTMKLPDVFEPQPSSYSGYEGGHASNYYAGESYGGQSDQIYEQADHAQEGNYQNPNFITGEEGNQYTDYLHQNTKQIKEKPNVLKLFLCIGLFFIVGTIIGLLFCPGYFEIIPSGKEVFPQFFGQTKEKNKKINNVNCCF